MSSSSSFSYFLHPQIETLESDDADGSSDYPQSGYPCYSLFPIVQPQKTLGLGFFGDYSGSHGHGHGVPHLNFHLSNTEHLHSRFVQIPSSSEPTGERSMIERQGDYQNNLVTDSTLVSSSSTVSVPADIITEILRRLPAKDIMRFKCVCKSWNSLAQEHSFISQHLENRPESKDLGIITLYWDGCEFSIRHFVNGYHKLDMTDLFKDKRYRLSNPCDGLVCVCGTRTTYVVNPSIREVVILPETKNSSRASIALGKNISTGDYVLVRLFRCSFTRTGCEIFTLGSHTWRVIQDAPCAIDYECVPVLLNGILHWLTGGHGIPEIAISFDVNAETFDVIMKPEGFGCPCYMDIVELNGHLCLTYRVEDDIQEYKDIWVLKDYGRQGWVRWRIMLQTEIFPLRLAYYMTPVMVRDGKMLWRTVRGRFDYYDTASRRFVETHYDPLKNVYCLRNICPYMESLGGCQPAFLLNRNPGEYGEDVCRTP